MGEPVVEPYRLVPCFLGGHLPKGYEHATGPEDMPLVTMNADQASKPGDKFRIRLHVRGKYMRVEWSKAKGADAIAPMDERKQTHTYSMIGDHSYWIFDDFEIDDSEEGLYVKVIQLLKD